MSFEPYEMFINALNLFEIVDFFSKTVLLFYSVSSIKVLGACKLELSDFVFG